MNSKFVFLTSFLFGLFITLSFFILSKDYVIFNNTRKIENFFSGLDNTDTQDEIQTEENIIETQLNNEEISTDIVAKQILPKKDSKYMLITTYNDRIVNSEQKWYDEDINNINSTEYNEGAYFILDTPIEYYKNNNTSIIKGAIIKKVQLTGPNALYFANNYNVKNYELSSFSIVFMMKVNEIPNNLTLFEMLANTSVKNSDEQNINYIANSITLIFKINETGNYNIVINIGNSKYDVVNIDRKNLIGVDIITLGLIYDGVNVRLSINNNMYIFKYTANELITLGSSPIIINKDGGLDAILYSFIYYKIALTDADLVLLKNYNNYYIYGLYNTDSELLEKNKSLTELQNDLNAKEAEIADLNARLELCNNTNYNLMNSANLELENIDLLTPPYPTEL